MRADHPRMLNMQTGIRKWAFEQDPVFINQLQAVTHDEPITPVADDASDAELR